jgi:hypothetical protein
MAQGAKYTRDTLYGLWPTQATELWKEVHVRAVGRARDEELAKFVEEVRGEIVDQAKERLAQWVAEQEKVIHPEKE